jgi:CRP-like cAMP-binding protein
MAADLRAAVRRIGEFASLSDESLDALIAAATPLSFAPGELLMAQGDLSEFADLLLQGEVEIAADSARGAIPVAGISAPALVGDLGALAGCRALRACARAGLSPCCACRKPRWLKPRWARRKC